MSNWNILLIFDVRLGLISSERNDLLNHERITYNGN